jgi:hypothetical protein
MLLLAVQYITACQAKMHFYWNGVHFLQHSHVVTMRGAARGWTKSQMEMEMQVLVD